MWDKNAAVVQNELGLGERILWSGQPQHGLRLQASDTFLIPFSFFWGGFALFWEFGVITSGAPMFFWLWGMPFVLVGFYLILGRFFVDAWLRQNTFYALTNERILILSGLFRRQVTSLNLNTLDSLSLTEKSKGRGTLTFGPTQPMGWIYGGSGWPGAGRYTSPSFDTIEDVAFVYDQIQQAQNEIVLQRA